MDRKLKVISSAVEINPNFKVKSSDVLSISTSSQLNTENEQIYSVQNKDIDTCIILPHTPIQHLTNTDEEDMENRSNKIDINCDIILPHTPSQHLTDTDVEHMETSSNKIDINCEAEKAGCLCEVSSYSHEIYRSVENVENSLQSVPTNENSLQSMPTNENTQHFVPSKHLLSTNKNSQHLISTNGNTGNLLSFNENTEHLLPTNNENTHRSQHLFLFNENTESLLSINEHLIKIKHSCEKDSKMVLKAPSSNICDAKQDSCRNKTYIDPHVETEFAEAIRENFTIKEDHIETERFTDLHKERLRGKEQFPLRLNISRSSSVESLNQDDLVEGIQENVDNTFQNETATNYDFDLDNPFILLEERSTEHDVQEDFLDKGSEVPVKDQILEDGTKVQKELIKGGKRQRKRNNRQQGPKKTDTNDFHSMFEAAYRWVWQLFVIILSIGIATVCFI